MLWDSQPQIVYPKSIALWGRKFPAPQGFPIGGFIQLTYSMSCEILQISPACLKDLPPHFFNVVKKWIIPFGRNVISKPILYGKLMRLAKLAVSPKINFGGWSLSFPRISEIGELIEENGVIFPYWVTEKVCGRQLTKNKKNQGGQNERLRLYHLFVEFLARLHSLNNQREAQIYFAEIGILDLSLLSYYRKRIRDLVKCLEVIKGSSCFGTDQIFRAIELANYFLRQLSRLVGNEGISLIHGDFREDNIIVNFKKKKIWIIDFEQGLFGGDWLADLWKLSLFSDNSTFSFDKRHELINCYCNIRQNFKSPCSRLFDNFLASKQQYLEERIDLIRFDLFTSFLILRYLMGWHFKKRLDPRGREVRGDLFALDLLEKVIKRRLNKQ